MVTFRARLSAIEALRGTTRRTAYSRATTELPHLAGIFMRTAIITYGH